MDAVFSGCGCICIVNPLEFAAMETVRSTAVASDLGIVITLITLILILVALRAIIIEIPWIDVASVRIHLAQLKWREVIRSRLFSNPYVAKFDDPMMDGCQGTKDFLA